MQASDIRNICVINLKSVTDCAILLDELDHAATQIEEDIRVGFGGPEWEKRARRALEEVEHKGRLIQQKHDALKCADAGPYPDHVCYAIRFHEAAIKALTPEELERVKSVLRIV